MTLNRRPLTAKFGKARGVGHDRDFANDLETLNSQLQVTAFGHSG